MKKLPYSCYQFNSPEEGNKRIYAYGPYDDTPLKHCGYIEANNLAEASKCLTLLKHKCDVQYVFVKNCTQDEMRTAFNLRRA